MEPITTRAARVESMAEAMRADVDASGRKAKLYTVEIDVTGGTATQAYNRDFIRAVAGAVAYNVERDRRDKVDLFDVESVRERVIEYCEACALSGLMPTVSGLCGWSLKISRQWLSKFKRDNPRHPTTDLLNVISEIFADAVINTSLAGATNAVMALFMLKNTANYTDKPEAEGEDMEQSQDWWYTASHDEILARIRAEYLIDDEAEGQTQDYSATEGGNNGD